MIASGVGRDTAVEAIAASSYIACGRAVAPNVNRNRASSATSGEDNFPKRARHDGADRRAKVQRRQGNKAQSPRSSHLFRHMASVVPVKERFPPGLTKRRVINKEHPLFSILAAMALSQRRESRGACASARNGDVPPFSSHACRRSSVSDALTRTGRGQRRNRIVRALRH